MYLEEQNSTPGFPARVLLLLALLGFVNGFWTVLKDFERDLLNGFGFEGTERTCGWTEQLFVFLVEVGFRLDWLLDLLDREDN